MTNAIASAGTQLLREDTPGGGVFTAIAEITGFNGPNMSRDMIDVTNIDSPGNWKEHIPSFRDGGDISLDMNFTNATYQIMFNDFTSEVEQSYKIQFSDTLNSSLEFNGYVTGCPITVATEDAVKSSTSIKVTGVIAFSDDS